MKVSFNQQISLPKISSRQMLCSFLLLLLPNIAFLLLAWFTKTARPLVNIDYFLSAILLSTSIRPVKWVGILLFWWALIMDSLMFVMQLFPFMDFDGALQLLPFILSAPWLYKVLSLVLIVYMVGMPIFLEYLGKKTNCFHTLLLCVPIAVVGYFTGHLQYYERELQANLFGRNNFYYAKSQFELYQSTQDFDFLLERGVDPVFSPLKFDQASRHLLQPYSRKILFIVNESWGQPKNPALQEAVLGGLLAQKDRFEFWESGHFRFVGATVQGEIRELCSLSVDGFALKRTPASQFAGCLPNKLKQQGYTTMALHGASSALYDRSSWWPEAGFNQITTAEYLIGQPTCMAFNGVCDSALFDNVSQAFSTHDKLFFYWMTLTSHADYPEKDLFNHRLQCEQYGLPKETMLCGSFSLQTQFFDGLAELIKQPEMRGVEVIVVGDHSPPVMDLGEAFKYLTEGGEVAWIHFKVKE